MNYYFDQEVMKNYQVPEVLKDDTDRNLKNLKTLIEKGYVIESYYDHRIAENDAGIKFAYPDTINESEYALFIDIFNAVVRRNPLYEKFCKLGVLYITDNSMEDMFDTSCVKAGWSVDFVINADQASINKGTEDDMPLTYHVVTMVTFLDLLARIAPQAEDIVKVVNTVREIK